MWLWRLCHSGTGPLVPVKGNVMLDYAKTSCVSPRLWPKFGEGLRMMVICPQTFGHIVCVMKWMSSIQPFGWVWPHEGSNLAKLLNTEFVIFIKNLLWTIQLVTVIPIEGNSRSFTRKQKN